MKIAIIISGHMRTYHPYVKFLKGFFMDHDYDIFIFTHRENYIKLNYAIEQPLIKINDVTLTDLQSHYGKNLKVAEFYEDNSQKEKRKLYRIKEMLAKRIKKYNLQISEQYIDQYYCFYRAFGICETYLNENSIKYDIVVRFRPDMMINSKIKLECDNNVLRVFGYINENNHSYVNDLFFFGDFNIMKKMSTFVLYYYSTLEEKYLLAFADRLFLILAPEPQLGYFISKIGIKYIISQINVHFYNDCRKCHACVRIRSEFEKYKEYYERFTKRHPFYKSLDDINMIIV